MAFLLLLMLFVGGSYEVLTNTDEDDDANAAQDTAHDEPMVGDVITHNSHNNNIWH